MTHILTPELPGISGSGRLQSFIAEHSVDAEIVSPGVPMPTVPLAAAAIGVRVEQIVKSVLFQDGASYVVLAIARGTARIDRQRLGEIVGGRRLRLADPETVLRATGYPAGGVAPIGHATPLEVVIDQRVMALPHVYGGAGTEDTLLKIAPADILRLTGGLIAGITGPSPSL